MSCLRSPILRTVAGLAALLVLSLGPAAAEKKPVPGMSSTPDSVRSYPPDKTDYVRESVAGDANPLGDVTGAFAPSVFLRNLVVSNTDLTLFANDTAGDGEPSIAINPNDPNEIVILAFSGNDGSGNSALWHTTDGGNTWSKLFTMADPANDAISCDQAPDWGSSGILAVTHLGCTGGNRILTGTTTDPTSLAAWNWSDDGDTTVEFTNETCAGNGCDQPWLLINWDPANLTDELVHNAYDDFDAGINMQVVSDDLEDPTAFEVGDDETVGSSTGGGVNPGHRQAKDIRTGYIYSGWQNCTANCACGTPATCTAKTIDFMLNRSIDGGATWTLNGSGTGIVAATNDSVQPWPKFGGVNALLGGIIHLAVDPTLGHVYYVYGDHDGTNQRLSIRRFQDDGAGNMVSVFTNLQFTPAGKDAAIPSVAVTTTGTVGVFYYTFDGFSSDSFPIFTAWLALSDDEAATFTHKKLLTFLSSAKDAGYATNGALRQRVLGDYVQLKTVGRTFYGTFTGNGAPFGRPVSNHDPYFYKETVGPIINLEAPNDFGSICLGDVQQKKLEISNTGFDPLIINSVTMVTVNPEMTLLPTPTPPLTIQPGAEVGFDVQCRGLTSGAKTGVVRISSNDPDQPVIDVTYTCTVGGADIDATLLSALDFGDVCIGDVRTENLTIHNSGACPLTVSNITSGGTDAAAFQVGSVTSFPLVVEAGGNVQVPVEFEPVSGGATGAKSGTLTIASDDPDTPSLVLNVAGTAPTADAVAFIANSGSFGDVCADTLKDLELTIQNNGLCPLSVTAVALSGANPGDFSLPSGFAPVVLESLNSIVMPVRFQPTEFVTASPRTASVDVTNTTAYSSDATVVDSTAVSGTVPPPDINVPANTGADPEVEFGNVCAGAVVEKEIPVCNTGLCTLTVTSATLSDGAGGACDDFTIVQNPFPSEVSHDFCMSVVVRYTPTETGEHSCVLTIVSDDPDEGSIDITLHGTTPATIIDIPGDLYFSPEVVQTIDACSTLKPYPISNNGICPLTITDISIDPASENSGDYGLDGLPSFPIILQTGHIAGEGDLDVVFAPNEPLDRDKLGILSVTYVSDAVTGTTTTVDSNLCGEATLTGARVLVTYGGSPVSTVERIQIQRINANRNRRPQLDTVSVLQNVPLQEYIPSGDPEYSACRGFRYHSEYGTVGNPLQLLPGVYQVNATIRVNGRRYTKSVGFSVNACDFNPTVVVTF